MRTRYFFPKKRNKDIAQAFTQNTDIMDSASTSYPKRNLTLENIYFFWFAPTTFTYQIVFPKLAKRDPQKIVFLVLLRLFLCFVLLDSLVAQTVRPLLHDIIDERMLSVYIIAEHLMEHGIASCYIWLLVLFCGFFESYSTFGRSS
jgi:hypothetical protein